MLTDRYGYPLSTTSQAARDAYVAGYDGVLMAGPTDKADLRRAIEADPDFALARIALARASFIVADVATAREQVAKARELAPKLSAREQSHVNALALAMEGKPLDSFEATKAHLAEYPRDALVASPATGVFGLIGFSGRQGREPEQVEFLEKLKKHLADDWWFQMVYAFALEEVGQLDEALDQIERSMAAMPLSAHGAHIKAHVLYERGEDRKALDYLDRWMPGYSRDGMMHCHLSWHVAMFALTLGETDRAWKIYASGVHPGGAWGPALNVATDAPAFLWRAELAGQPRKPEAWQQVNAYVQKSFPKAGIGFVDVHRALSAVAANDSAALGPIVAELEERAAKAPTGPVVPGLARGLAAYGRGDWAGAIAEFEPALAATVRIGGSRAQRDLILNTLLAAYIKSGHVEKARALATSQADRRPSVPVAGLA